MKIKPVRFAVCAMLPAVMALFYASCSRELPHINEYPDVNVDIWVAVREIEMFEEYGEEKYYAILDNGRILRADLFEADEMTIFNVGNDCFDAYIAGDKNKVLNRLMKVEITDDAGNVLTNDSIIKGIFREIGKF